MSVSHSRVAETLRFLAAASAIVVSRLRVIALRFSCWSFCSRGVIGFLSGFEDKGVVCEQRDRVGSQCVQMRVAQLQRRLWPSRSLLLAQNVGHIIRAECSCRGCLLDGLRDRVGAILA